MQLYTIPALYCPFPTYIHPLVHEIEEQTNQWILDHHLLDSYETYCKYKDYQFATFIARSFPFGDYIDICIWSNFNTLLFIVDDKFDDEETINDHETFHAFKSTFMEVIEKNIKCTIKNDGPILAALSNIWSRLLLRSSAAWQQKFIKCVIDMFSGLGWQFDLIRNNKLPDLKKYMEIRQYLGAAHMSTESLEITGKISLPEYVYKNPKVQKLTEISRNTICFANDLFSLAKESEESQNGGEFNLVTILKHKYNLNIEEAIKGAAEIHDALVKEFLEISKHIYIYDIDINNMLLKYVQALECQMIANIVWSTKETTRYPHIYGYSERVSELIQSKVS
jgi:hypothetical protein